jgi:hypothetical protein
MKNLILIPLIILLTGCASMDFVKGNFNSGTPLKTITSEVDVIDDKLLEAKEGDVIGIFKKTTFKKYTWFKPEDDIAIFLKNKKVAKIEKNNKYEDVVTVYYGGKKRNTICIKRCPSRNRAISLIGGGSSASGTEVLALNDENGLFPYIFTSSTIEGKFRHYPEEKVEFSSQPVIKKIYKEVPYEQYKVQIVVKNLTKYGEPVLVLKHIGKDIRDREVKLNDKTYLKCGESCYIVMTKPEFGTLNYTIKNNKEQAMSHLSKDRSHTWVESI